MTTVAVDIAQKELPNLIEDVRLGGHVLITKDNEPVAELIPIRGEKPRPKFGSARGEIWMSEDFDAPLEDFAEYTK